MRAVIDIKIKASQDTNGRRVLFSNENDNTARPQTVDVWQRATSGLLNIPAGSAETLPLGDVDSPTGVYIQFSGDADITFNGGAEALNIRVPTDSQGNIVPGLTAPLYLPIAFTSLSITNASSTVALTAEYLVVGDPE